MNRKWTRSPLIWQTLIALSFLCAPPISHGATGEISDRDSLIKFVTRPIPDSPRNQRYIAFMNRELDDKYLGINTDWFQKGGGGYISRAQTQIVGQLAFCYHTKGLKYFHDPKVLGKIQLAFDGVIKHISEEGKFTWTKNLNDYGYDSEVHEHGWRIEPLILALICMGDDLGKDRRDAAEAALLRAATWMAKHPLIQHNNRGAVWCATTTLAGLYFDKKEFRDIVEKYSTQIITSIVLDDGESGEHTAQYGGGGPDANYSYTGWSYVYLYRVLSGRQDLDERLQRALRWFSIYNTRSGCPVVSGASVRRRYANPEGLFDLLPALERYSHADPFFAGMADRVMDKKEKYLKPQAAGHLISPFIWAMLEDGVTTPAAASGEKRGNITRIYDRPQVQYALISREYQTGITFRGRTAKGYDFSLRGMQTFAWGDEYPILLHTDTHNSTTRADGIDTAAENVDKSADGWEALQSPADNAPNAAPDLATITTRTKTLWTIYAYTPASAVVVFGGARSDIVTQWVMNRRFVPAPRLDAAAGRVTFEGRHGTIYFLKGEAKLADIAAADHDDAATTLEVVTPPSTQIFAFSNESFRFGASDAAKQELNFADESGHYALSFADVLDANGNLKRSGPMRLHAVEQKHDKTSSAEIPAYFHDPFANPPGTPGLPRVLLIGDSISIGYTIPVRRLLAGTANVHRIPVNGQATGYGLSHLKAWLGDGKWDVIHFNWGMWDFCYRNPKAQTQGHRDKVNGTVSITPEQYRENLERIVTMLQQTGAKLIWCSNTPVPDGEAGRIKGDEIKYNAIAAEIMKKHGIAIDDLYTHAMKRTPGIYIGAGDVHFSESGYEYLAEAVAQAVGKALESTDLHH
ncbi:MAG TPA: SGNH/GDSL hydrolase family protein [Humisphaera sp.]|nr:SGNH/GDSL hydrolase family protein [Humisphaera sp.]